MAIFDGLSIKIKNNTKDLCLELAELIVERASKHVQSKTGHLVSTGFAQETNTGAVCGFNCEYAVFVHEKRTPTNKSQQFLTLGVNEVMSVLDEDSDVVLERVIYGD